MFHNLPLEITFLVQNYILATPYFAYFKNYFTPLCKATTELALMQMEILFQTTFILGSPKGQLISKCLFGVFNSPKRQTKTIWLEIP